MYRYLSYIAYLFYLKFLDFSLINFHCIRERGRTHIQIFHISGTREKVSLVRRQQQKEDLGDIYIGNRPCSLSPFLSLSLPLPLSGVQSQPQRRRRRRMARNESLFLPSSFSSTSFTSSFDQRTVPTGLRSLAVDNKPLGARLAKGKA